MGATRIRARRITVKRFYVANLREGAKIEDVFLVASKTLRSTRSGSPFLKLKLADKTGTVEAVKWEATESEIAGLVEDEYVHVQGTVGVYNDELQVAIESVQKFSDKVDPSDFIASSERDPDEMMCELAGVLEKVTDASLRRLLDAFFEDEGFAARFRQSPAAMRVHHAYIGGLLEHTLNVVKCCAALAELYPDANKDLLLTAAALHDVGKTDELEWARAIKYSDAGHLVGHVAGGAMMVKEAADRIEGLDAVLNLELQHAMLSHHGEKAFGAPVQPMSLEAMILHHADNLDAKVGILSEAIKESDRSGDKGLFTKRHFLLDHALFKGLRGPEAEEAEPGEESPDTDALAADADHDPFSDES